ncbi:uncharacterized protein LOC134293132 isoform X3 [Anolis carolinensis]|uniref:uncharacterized protein LOC134293132 isoform X3 n=1 Tax=Anolis carolinensis TaxID=28377 RepID=UPI002F2B38FF
MSLPPGDHRGLRGSPSTTMTGRPVKGRNPSQQRTRLPPLAEAPLEVLGSALRPGGSSWLARTTASHLPTPLPSRPASPVTFIFSSKRDGHLPPLRVLMDAASLLLEPPAGHPTPPVAPGRTPRGTPQRGRVQDASFQDPRGLFLRPLREQAPLPWPQGGPRATPFRPPP